MGGAAARGVTTVLVGARRVAAWGEPARPGLPPEGETEKGERIIDDDEDVVDDSDHGCCGLFCTDAADGDS